MTAQPHEPLTQAEFLAWELEQEDKHEYVDGYIYGLFGDRTAKGFAGGTGWHARIAMELGVRIAPAIRPFRTYGSDMLIETWKSSRYADLFVTCDERDRDEARAMRHPKLVIEVLSESTAKDDLGPKMREYQTIETLEEYLVLDSRKRWAQVARRHEASWVLAPAVNEGALILRSVGVTIDLDELYSACGLAADLADEE